MPLIDLPTGTKLDPTAPPPQTAGGQGGRLIDLPSGAALDRVGQAPPEKVYYNEAGLPFTLSGRPVPPSTEYSGSVIPLHYGEGGWFGTKYRPAIPEAITSTVRGMETGGAQAVGRAPVSRLLEPETTMAVGALVGTPLMRAPAGALGPSTLVPGGRLASAATPDLLPPKPASINPERLNLAQKAMARGIPITAGRISESGMTKVAESQGGRLPFSGAPAHENEIQKAWNRNVAQTFGENADRVTREVMNRAKTRIGGDINRIEDSHNVAYSDAVVQKLADIETRAQSSLTAEEFSPVRRLLEGTMRNLMPGDQIAGATYGSLFRKGSPLDAAAASKNANISHYASEIMDALRDGLQQSLSPEEAAAYRTARFQYKNMMTVRPLVTKATGGDISPALLRGRVDVQFPNAAFETGTNPLDELAQIGQAFLKEPPSSFTTERSVVQRTLEAAGRHAGGIFTGGAATGAAGVGLATHTGLLPAAVGVGTTLGLNRALQSYLRSPGRAERALTRGERRIERGTKPRVPGAGPRKPLTRIGQYVVGGDISPYVRDDRVITNR